MLPPEFVCYEAPCPGWPLDPPILWSFPPLLLEVLYPLIYVFGLWWRLWLLWAPDAEIYPFPDRFWFELFPFELLMTLPDPFIFFIAGWFVKPAELIALMLLTLRFFIVFGVLALWASSSSLLSLVRIFSSIKKSTPPLNWSTDVSSFRLETSWPAASLVNPDKIYLFFPDDLALLSAFESNKDLSNLTLSIL